MVGRLRRGSVMKSMAEEIWAQTRGNVAMVFALALPIVVGGAGFGVETTYWYYRSLELQAAADAAAHAGAMERRSGSSNAQVAEIAVLAATDNGFDPAIGSSEVNTPPTSGPSAGGDGVEVILKTTADRFFTRMFMNGEVDLTARAVATYRTASNACVLALDPSESRAADFAGNTQVTLVGCSVMANSRASNAVNLQGSARLSVNCLISGGGATIGTGATLTECRAPILNAPSVADPYADIPQPNAQGGCLTASGSSLAPGRYCSGMRLSGAVTLQPGVYFISGGDFRINANADVRGSGVTFVLLGNSGANFNGNSTINLSAPTTGPQAGILFFGDRHGGGASVLNGTAASRLTGAVYLPRQALSYLGNFSGQQGCVRVVARTVTWSGSTELSADCSDYGIPAVPVMQVVQLTE